MAIEKLGIQHIGKSIRHGKPFITFTLWLAANLTIADYALGTLLYGLSLNYIIIAVLIGNLLAGLMLGLMAAMGPKFGYPQMMISRAYFGKRGNAPFAIANWISTVGWFTVNIVLGGYALQLILGTPFVAGAALLVLIQAALAIYGHDVIHKFEIVMAVVLALMFIGVGIIAYNGAAVQLPAYNAATSFSMSLFALIVAASFSYLMSWSPYASDYSRYLPEGTSRFKIAIYAMIAGVIACVGIELIGTLVYISVGSATINPIAALAQVAGPYAIFALGAIMLGSITANSLNLYTNSLSAQIVYEKIKRWQAVIAASVIGFVLAVFGAVNFALFYQNFLLTLDYWITPWIGIMIGAFFFNKIISGVNRNSGMMRKPIVAYLLGLVVSVPFMNLTSYGIPYEGVVATALSGADVSYFVSFAAALILYLAFTRIALFDDLFANETKTVQAQTVLER
jgi:NCS1 family nucleobase:cation symporter-1